MKEYHKIHTIYKRDKNTKHKTLLEGQFSLPELEYLQNNTWVWDEKVDGTNIRIVFDGEKIRFGGKTDNADIPANLLNRLNERFIPQLGKFKEVFGENDTNVVFYGEGYGPKIQSIGGNYRKDQDFILFDIKIGNTWLNRDSVINISKNFGLDIVPIVGKGTLKEAIEYTRKGFNSTWGNFFAEGLVLRPEIQLLSRMGHRIITKIKYKDFG